MITISVHAREGEKLYKLLINKSMNLSYSGNDR